MSAVKSDIVDSAMSQESATSTVKSKGKGNKEMRKLTYFLTPYHIYNFTPEILLGLKRLLSAWLTEFLISSSDLNMRFR